MPNLINVCLYLFSYLSLFWIIILEPANAQISSDGTLPTNVTSPDNLNFTINGGSQAGNNLFHSFREFSVPGGGSAIFNNAADIQNIFGRVTGGNISDIKGLIRANGTANLFLLNPRGFLFGPGASLQIGGSFIGSTADSILFPNNVEFSATNTNTPPLLTINVPLGLQYGNNPGDITVNGTGNRLRMNRETFAVDRTDPPTGLKVQPGQTLALVGGNISLTGGNLTAHDGRVELGSVAGGTVQLTSNNPENPNNPGTPSNPGWAFNYDNVTNFQDISLLNGLPIRPGLPVYTGSSVEVSGNGEGTIQVQGKRISISDGSAMLADTLGNGTGGNLIIKATESLEVSSNPNSPVPFFSRLSTDVGPGATGVGGKLTIDTKTLMLSDGSQLSTGTFSSGKAGTMEVTAEDVQISGAGPLGPSGLFAPVAPNATGAGGNILLNTNRLQVDGGGQISTITFGDGNAGDLDIKAQEVELVGTTVKESGEFSSGFLVRVERGAKGNGGNLTLEANTLELRDGAQIIANTVGEGNAGNLHIKANDIELTGIGASSARTSGFFANVQSGAVGKGGNLTVEAQNLYLAQQAQIAARVLPNAIGTGGNLDIKTNTLEVVAGAAILTATGGSGNAGNLTVSATQSVEITGTAAQRPSGLFASAIADNGDGGNITLTTGQLAVKDGGTISVSNFSSTNPDIAAGTGKAGDIDIQATSILLDSTTPENPSTITASTMDGGGGNISMDAQESFIARNDSQILAETKGSGDGGTININSKLVELTNGAAISTNSIGDGQAGDININFETLETNRGQITATSEKTGGGNITLTSTASEIFLRNNSLISTSVFDSTGGGGNITITSDVIAALENSDIRANAAFGPGGNIQINTTGIFLSRDSDIDASSSFGIDGAVEINRAGEENLNTEELPEGLLDRNQIISKTCSTQNNSFSITGKGGLPANPTKPLRNQTLWSDLRDLNGNITQQPKIRNSANLSTAAPVGTKLQAKSNQSSLVEAQGWIVNSDGEVEFVVNPPGVTSHRSQNLRGGCHS